jgi:hypothetical protein
MWGMQVLTGHGKDSKWDWVHPTNGQPYQYPTKKEAEQMLRICYPLSTNVRVMEF